jgi:hypothetical protein
MINNLIAKGNKVVFANSYGYGSFIPEIAKKHPEVYFIVQVAFPKGPKTAATAKLRNGSDRRKESFGAPRRNHWRANSVPTMRSNSSF